MSRDYHAGNHFGPFTEVISFGLVGLNFISNSTWLDFSHPPILSLFSLILTRIYLFIIKTGYGEKMCITSFEGDKNKILN